MKVRVNREEFAQAMGAAVASINPKTFKDILKCVRLDVAADVMTVSATDLEIGLTYSCSQIETQEPGATLVDADLLRQIVSNCGDEVLAIETDKSKLFVRGQSRCFDLSATWDNSDFPPIPTMEGKEDYQIDFAVLQAAINRTVFAVAKESTRYALNGLQFEFKGKELRLAATDGRRLAVETILIPKGSAKPALLPPRFARLLARLSCGEGAVAQIKVLPNLIFVKSGAVSTSSTLVEGNFPEIDQHLSPLPNSTVISAAEWLAALKSASPLVSIETSGVKHHSGESFVTLRGRRAEKGGAEISVPHDGKISDFCCDWRYMAEGLAAIGKEDVAVWTENNRRPVILKSGGWSYVLMPINWTE